MLLRPATTEEWQNHGPPHGVSVKGSQPEKKRGRPDYRHGHTPSERNEQDWQAVLQKPKGWQGPTMSWGKRQPSICLGACDHFYPVQHRSNGRGQAGREKTRGRGRELRTFCEGHLTGSKPHAGPLGECRGAWIRDRTEEAAMGEEGNRQPPLTQAIAHQNPSLWSALFSWRRALQNRETRACNESWTTTYQLCHWKLSSPYLTTSAKQRLISLQGGGRGVGGAHNTDTTQPIHRQPAHW